MVRAARDKASPPEIPVMAFVSAREWATWLEANHAKSAGVWIHFAKKDSGILSVSYAEALDVALCHGWIDSQKRSFDARTFIQKFTPRGKRSIWSAINRDKALALIENQRMRAAGLAEVERARADGRWDAAYEPQARAAVPPDLQEALDANGKAAAFFATLKGQNRYAILFRIHTARKAETRARRIADFVAMLARHETFH